jgi:hypothetical protein
VQKYASQAIDSGPQVRSFSATQTWIRTWVIMTEPAQVSRWRGFSAENTSAAGLQSDATIAPKYSSGRVRTGQRVIQARPPLLRDRDSA